MPFEEMVFSYTGAPQTFTVMRGMSPLQFDVFGAGTGSDDGPSGGRTNGTILAHPGTILSIWVGGLPVIGGSAGWPDGGAGGIGGSTTGLGGGGSSSIRWNGVSDTDRIVVAGGAGTGASGGVYPTGFGDDAGSGGGGGATDAAGGSGGVGLWDNPVSGSSGGFGLGGAGAPGQGLQLIDAGSIVGTSKGRLGLFNLAIDQFIVQAVSVPPYGEVWILPGSTITREFTSDVGTLFWVGFRSDVLTTWNSGFSFFPSSLGTYFVGSDTTSLASIPGGPNPYTYASARKWRNTTPFTASLNIHAAGAAVFPDDGVGEVQANLSYEIYRAPQRSGGGGGGGYYGGGGGGSANVWLSANSLGGGGGSSWVDLAHVQDVGFFDGTTDEGSVVLTWSGIPPLRLLQRNDGLVQDTVRAVTGMNVPSSEQSSVRANENNRYF